MTWRDRAECRGQNPELFFPGTTGQRNTVKALRICVRCPVIDECLRHAMQRPELYGVWGGCTENERLRMRRSRRHLRRLRQAVSA